jgi:hypothetical protein
MRGLEKPVKKKSLQEAIDRVVSRRFASAEDLRTITNWASDDGWSRVMNLWEEAGDWMVMDINAFNMQMASDDVFFEHEDDMQLNDRRRVAFYREKFDGVDDDPWLFTVHPLVLTASDGKTMVMGFLGQLEGYSYELEFFDFAPSFKGLSAKLAKRHYVRHPSRISKKICLQAWRYSKRTSQIHPDLIKAYERAVYRTSNSPSIVLQVGKTNGRLTTWLRKVGVHSCAFLTACNPHGVLVDAKTNHDRQSELKKVLTDYGYPLQDGLGQSISGDWPDEPSCLIPGISYSDAVTVGKLFDQNAIVWLGELSAYPELILLR